jgi:hypothetical protein
MTTITIDNDLNLSKTHFESLEDFHLYLIQKHQNSTLSLAHRKILDERLAEAEQNPTNFITLDELKSSMKRK